MDCKSFFNKKNIILNLHKLNIVYYNDTLILKGIIMSSRTITFPNHNELEGYLNDFQKDSWIRDNENDDINQRQWYQNTKLMQNANIYCSMSISNLTINIQVEAPIINIQAEAPNDFDNSLNGFDFINYVDGKLKSYNEKSDGRLRGGYGW